MRSLKLVLLIVSLLGVYKSLHGAEVGADWQRLVAAAKKEGKIVIGAPPGNDFRNQVQAVLKKRFDLDSEFVQAPGPSLMSKIAAEKQAGAVSVDAFLIGPCGKAAAQTRIISRKDAKAAKEETQIPELSVFGAPPINSGQA